MIERSQQRSCKTDHECAAVVSADDAVTDAAAVAVAEAVAPDAEVLSEGENIAPHIQSDRAAASRHAGH